MRVGSSAFCADVPGGRGELSMIYMVVVTVYLAFLFPFDIKLLPFINHECSESERGRSVRYVPTAQEYSRIHGHECSTSSVAGRRVARFLLNGDVRVPQKKCLVLCKAKELMRK